MSLDLQFMRVNLYLNMDISPLRKWWKSSLWDGTSLEEICRETPAERMLVRHIEWAVERRKNRRLRDFIRSQFEYALKVIADPSVEPSFALPIWLMNLRGMACALSQWQLILSSLPDSVRAEFAANAWPRGIHYLTGGLMPETAIRIWKGAAEDFRKMDEDRKNRLAAASNDLQKTMALANEFGLAYPVVILEATTEAIELSVSGWRATVLKPFLLSQFWDANENGLLRTLSRATTRPDERRIARIKSLLLSAGKRDIPKLRVEISDLCTEGEIASQEGLAYIASLYGGSANTASMKFDKNLGSSPANPAGTGETANPKLRRIPVTVTYYSRTEASAPDSIPSNEPGDLPELN